MTTKDKSYILAMQSRAHLLLRRPRNVPYATSISE